MKKIFLTFFLLQFLSCGITFANITPLNSNDIPQNSLGVYQTDKEITVYSKPDIKSKTILQKKINFSNVEEVKYKNIMAIYNINKELGYLYVVDYDEDWIQVLVNKEKNITGWVKKEDDFQFLPWVNFYGMYGRKYGLVPFDKNIKFKLYSQSNEQSQILAEISKPEVIKLTAIEGIWALVSILDTSGHTYTGYIKWRSQDGEYYLFPDIK